MIVKTIEYIVILTLVVLQLYISYKIYIDIISYKDIFNNPPKVDSKFTTIEKLNKGDLKSILFDDNDDDGNQELIEVSYLSRSNQSKIMSNIVVPINTYLLKNKGVSIDFHILKDIVDRNLDISEDNIVDRIPAPLYIGLAATMLGIMFGLFSVSFDVASDSSAELALQAIKPLIDGVKLAMFASVVGLILTTLFSVLIFKNAKTIVESGKNKFLSLLQSELMPKMNTSKMPEVDILSKKLDTFSKNSMSMVSHLGTIINKSMGSIEREQQLLKDIRALDVRKVSSLNLDIFNKLDSMMGSFQSFAKYYEQLDNSLGNTTKLVSKLDKFVKNTDTINLVLEEVKSMINKGDQASDFFNQHIKSFSHYGNAVNESIADSDSRMSKAITVLGTSVEKQFEVFNESIAEYDSKLSTAFDNSIQGFNDTVQLQIEKTEIAFNNSRPKFEKLNELDKLGLIDKRLGQLETGLGNIIKETNREIVSAISSLSTDGFVDVEQGNKPTKKKDVFSKFYRFLKVFSHVVLITAGILVIFKILF